MPPKKGGGKNKWRKKKPTATSEASQAIPTVEKGQMYAIASKMLGNKRLLVKGPDGKERLAIIPGKFKGRRNWVSVGMLLLIGVRNYQDDKVDVIYIYSPKDAKQLYRNGELSDLLGEDIDDDCGVIFGEQPDDDVEAEDPASEPPLPMPDDDSDIDIDDL